jgi:salicylate hydroxylase
MTTRTVAVVGAGIGGLTAALALIDRGFDVTVFEQSNELREVGAGVQLGPNAMRVYAALGLDGAIADLSFVPEAHVVRNGKTGATIATTQMKGVYEAQYGIGYHTLLRADLQSLLASRLPTGALQLGKKSKSVTGDTAKATLQFEDGSQVASDVVVGADGIHSAIREHLLGKDSPRFTGTVAYRGVAKAEALPQGLLTGDVSVYIGPHASFVYYYIRRGELVNWVALVEETSWQQESWSAEADAGDILRLYEGWCPVVAELVSKTDRCYKWALFDRDPLPRWVDGRIALLGDAAHPMMPYLAQGGCMAIEDGYVLANELAKEKDDPARALRRYQTARLPRASRVQLMSRKVARVNQAPSLAARIARDLRLALQKMLNPRQHAYKIEWIYGFDVTEPQRQESAAFSTM